MLRKSNYNALKRTTKLLYIAPPLPNAFGLIRPCFAPENRAGKSRESSPVAAARIKRGTKADNYDRWRGRGSPLSAAPRATVTYATYDVPSQYIHPPLSYLTYPSRTRRARFPYHRCRNSNSLSLIKIKETSRAGLLDRVTRGSIFGRPCVYMNIRVCVCVFQGAAVL